LTQKLWTTESNAKISDYAPVDSEANVVPFIKGTVVAESVEAYKPKRHLSDTEKLSLGVAAFLFVFIGLLIVLPWVFKFMLLAFAYLFIFVASKGNYSAPTRGGNGGDSTPKRATGTSIVSRR
jgi:hypothetical protein